MVVVGVAAAVVIVRVVVVEIQRFYLSKKYSWPQLPCLQRGPGQGNGCCCCFVRGVVGIQKSYLILKVYLAPTPLPPRRHRTR